MQKWCMFVQNKFMAVAKKEKPIYEKWAEVIQERGLKQTWVAEKAGISPPHLSNILAGREFITPKTGASINAALGTDFPLPE